MTHILRVDASARDMGSISRGLGDHIEQRLKATMPDCGIVRRDLAANPLTHIANQTIVGYYTPPENMTEELRQATALSDELIAELRAADILLLTVPMYNFSIPSALKAWIDQVVRIGQTFSHDGTSFAGLLTGKKAIVACAFGAGGYATGAPFASANFVEPYLRFLLGFLGFAEVEFFTVETTTATAAVVDANVEAARQAVDTTLLAA